VKEPLWRLVLNWGCVAYFLGLPALTLLIGFFHLEVFPAGSHAPQFLGNFHLSVSALVAAMAGLNSFDQHKAKGKQETEKNNAPKE
jgi:hypothetical protein